MPGGLVPALRFSVSSVDWLIEWNRHYFEPKGLYVDLAWREENYWNLVVDSKDQHSHLRQAYVVQAAKHVRLLVAIIAPTSKVSFIPLNEVKLFEIK